VIERGKTAGAPTVSLREAQRAPAAALRTGIRPESLVAFERRVAKNFRHWSRWAKRQDVGAFRVYDRDLPEFPLAIDCYVPIDRPESPRLHVQELDTGWVQSEAVHAQWIAAVEEAIARATAIARTGIVFKERPRRRGHAQHTKRSTRGAPFLVAESGLRFWVDLLPYLDTGLFPDHRRMRAMVRERSRGRRMLNLFAYTGSFTVYAAAGGAIASDSVDLSNTYLAWAQRNFAANGLDPGVHCTIRADVLAWLGDARRERRRYDVIVCDPPAFSNSKSMRDVLDVQRDHPMLIEASRALLAPGGELYFSTNLRTFTLDPALRRESKDITAATRAEDFRDMRVHHAFLFARST